MKFFGLFTYHFVRKSAILCFTGIFMMGCLSLYDATVGDGDIPEPRLLGRLSPARSLAVYNTTRDVNLQTTEDEAWEKLQPTLVILKEVAPHVETWIRDRRRRGKFVVDMSDTGMYAGFDCVSREIKLRSMFFRLEDGEKACVIAHEWRHSKQNPTKFGKLIISFVITRELKTELVENDAYLYESDVHDSLYGTGANY